ncbi:nuclear transport factor 2-like protein [Paraburkholderia bannensis]|uniref:nuclear transport factor 2 family protein n=1 Tax=Paraburkholderia bannensis TaxID=765414 RepID=UPI002AB749FE|nr:nuclear transport factor 2 family protein [Paraburkholderia bannensis]
MQNIIRHTVLVTALAAPGIALFIGPSLAHSQEPTGTVAKHDDVRVAQQLIDVHFQIWNDPNSRERAAKFPLVYSPTFFVADESGVARGYAAVGRLIEELRASHEGFVFTPDPIAWNHGIGRVTWGYGPRDNPNVVRGEDVFTIEDGKLASARVFINRK